MKQMKVGLGLTYSPWSWQRAARWAGVPATTPPMANAFTSPVPAPMGASATAVGISAEG